jgi:hypothetical protein
MSMVDPAIEGMVQMTIRKLLLAATICALPAAAQAVTLVTTSDPGYYNDSIGTVLNLSNGGETGPFPVNNDDTLTFGTAPDLSLASSALGNWLTDPANLNGNWTLENPITNSWTPGDEVAIIYELNTLSATNVVADFGVDNGIFVWLDGVYKFGARAGGGPIPGEYSVNIGDLDAGVHYLQILLEDHGGSNGYTVDITADTFEPGPELPEPGLLALFGLGLAGIGLARRRRAA